MKKLMILAIGFAICSTMQAQDTLSNPVCPSDTLSNPSRSKESQIERPVYASVTGSFAFGDCTFRSISDRGTALGGGGTIAAGYRFSDLFSVEVNITVEGINTKAMSCCNYRLTLDGERLSAAHPKDDSWNYYDLKSTTVLRKYMLQGNFNVLSFFDDCPVSFDVAPQLGLAATTTTHRGPLLSTGAMTSRKYGSQYHFAVGGAGILGYAVNEFVGIRAYGSIDYLSGRRFDNIPEYVHNENFVFDFGIGVVFSFEEFWNR